mmetsp:Transcript_96273/g.170994  ORF Transcript_96273/g.170994 Transcript_96273/m.170994 type:complete len:830 (+) Transcript_96273:54-2543(+)
MPMALALPGSRLVLGSHVSPAHIPHNAGPVAEIRQLEVRSRYPSRAWGVCSFFLGVTAHSSLGTRLVGLVSRHGGGDCGRESESRSTKRRKWQVNKEKKANRNPMKTRMMKRDPNAGPGGRNKVKWPNRPNQQAEDLGKFRVLGTNAAKLNFREEQKLKELEEEGRLELARLAKDSIVVAVKDVSWFPPVLEAQEDGKTDTKEVLNDVNWKIVGNQKIGLIGDNGCGKSAQLAMLLDRIEPTLGEIVKIPADMEIAHMQQEANLDARKTVTEELTSVFGDRPLDEIFEEMQEASEDEFREDEVNELAIEWEAANENLMKVEELIPELQLEDFRNKLTSELSGGWQMRVGLGKIILSRPNLILLDEPTNHVDVETVEFMESFLNAQDIAMVIVSHDRYFLNRVCDHIVEIRGRRATSYEGNYVDYLRRRDRVHATEWRLWNLWRDHLLMLEKKLVTNQARFKLEVAARLKGTIEEHKAKKPPKPVAVVVQDFEFPCALEPVAPTEEASQQELPTPPILLDVQGMGVSFPDKDVFDNLSFSLRQGEKVALVGRNGCGKSCLVRAILQDLPDSASVRGSATYTDKGIAYFPQRLAEALNNERRKVKDTLYMTCSVAGIEEAGGMDNIISRLRLDGITKEQPVFSLSGGEKARVAFAQFLLSPAALLVLDEPTNHLDIATRELLEDAIKDYKGSALVVSHDRFFLREFATRVIEIVDGGLRDHESWEAYESAAPVQWQQHVEQEATFIKQDAYLLKAWKKKKMERLLKREGEDIGLRRTSPRVSEYEEVLMQEEEDRRNRQKSKRVLEELHENVEAQGGDASRLLRGIGGTTR